MNATDVDLAYAAGIVDGEGYVGVKKCKPRKDRKSPNYHARLQVKMVDREAVEFLAHLADSPVSIEKRQSKNQRSLFVLRLSDRKAERFLRAILPYLKVKVSVVETVLAYRDLQKNGPRHRTKITGSRSFRGLHGQMITVPNLSYSEEYLAMCDDFYWRCRHLNAVGAAAQGATG